MDFAPKEFDGQVADAEKSRDLLLSFLDRHGWPFFTEVSRCLDRLDQTVDAAQWAVWAAGFSEAA